MSDAELLISAKEHNFRFKAMVADVQETLFSGPWSTDGDYGAVPGNWFACGDDEYQFSLHRTGPVGVDPPVGPAALADRLRDRGWQAVEVREFPGVSEDIVVVATNPAGAVDRLLVTYFGDPRGISIVADSTCRPGDGWEILQSMLDDRGELPAYPSMEAPGDVPLFEAPR